MKVTQKQLKDLLHYSPTTGIWTWVKSPSRATKKGDIAGSICKFGKYRTISIGNRSYLSSRLAFLYMTGKFPKNEMDHRNRIRHDDSWYNLREVNSVGNARNMGINRRNKTGVSGVWFYKKHSVYRSYISVNYKNIYVKQDKSKLVVVKARYEAEKKYGFTKYNPESSAYLYLKKHGEI